MALGSLKSMFLTIGLVIEEQRHMGGFEIPDATIPDDCYDDGLVCEGLTWPVINALVTRKKVASRLIGAKRIRSRELIKSARVIGYDVSSLTALATLSTCGSSTRRFRRTWWPFY